MLVEDQIAVCTHTHTCMYVCMDLIFGQFQSRYKVLQFKYHYVEA